MVARHRNSTVKENKPTPAFPSKLIVRLRFFVATEVCALPLGCLLRNTNRLCCTQACALGLDVERAGLSRTRRLRATSKQQNTCEYSEAMAGENAHGAMAVRQQPPCTAQRMLGSLQRRLGGVIIWHSKPTPASVSQPAEHRGRCEPDGNQKQAADNIRSHCRRSRRRPRESNCLNDSPTQPAYRENTKRGEYEQTNIPLQREQFFCVHIEMCVKPPDLYVIGFPEYLPVIGRL